MTLALTVSCTSNVGDVEPAVKIAVALPLASVTPVAVVRPDVPASISENVAPLGLGAIVVKVTVKPLTRLPDASSTVAVRMLLFPAFSDVFSDLSVNMYPACGTAVLASLVMMIAFAAV